MSKAKPLAPACQSSWWMPAARSACPRASPASLNGRKKRATIPGSRFGMATGFSPARMNMTRTVSTAPGSTATPPKPRAAPIPQSDLCHKLAAHRPLFPAGMGPRFARRARGECRPPATPRLAVDTNATAAVVHVRLRAEADGGTDDRRGRTAFRRRQAPLPRDHTRAGTADLNDMPDFTLPDDAASVAFRFLRDGEAREKWRPLAFFVRELAHAGFCVERTTPVPPVRSCSPKPGWRVPPRSARAPPNLSFTRAEADAIHFTRLRRTPQKPG